MQQPGSSNCVRADVTERRIIDNMWSRKPYSLFCPGPRRNGKRSHVVRLTRRLRPLPCSLRTLWFLRGYPFQAPSNSTVLTRSHITGRGCGWRSAHNVILGSQMIVDWDRRVHEMGSGEGPGNTGQTGQIARDGNRRKDAKTLPTKVPEGYLGRIG